MGWYTTMFMKYSLGSQSSCSSCNMDWNTLSLSPFHESHSFLIKMNVCTLQTLYSVCRSCVCVLESYLTDDHRVAAQKRSTHQINFFFQILRILGFLTLLGCFFIIVWGVRQFVVIIHSLEWTKWDKIKF